MAFDEHDLSLVPPHKRNQVRQRIAAVQRYIADPRREVAEREASNLGLSIHSLHKLAKAWRAVGRAEALSGAGAPRKRRDQLTSEQHVVLDLAYRQLPDASLARVEERAMAIAAARDVPMPSPDAVKAGPKRILEHRIPPASYAVGTDFIVEHCAVSLPVDDGKGGAVMPIATLVIEVATREVRGLDLRLAGPSAIAAAFSIINAFSTGFPAGDGRRPVLALETFPGEDWERLERLLTQLPLLVRSAQRKRLGRLNLAVALLGDRHKGVWLRPRMTVRDVDARPMKMPAGGKLLTLQAADTYLREHWIPQFPIAGELLTDARRLYRFQVGATFPSAPLDEEATHPR